MASFIPAGIPSSLWANPPAIPLYRDTSLLENRTRLRLFARPAAVFFYALLGLFTQVTRGTSCK